MHSDINKAHVFFVNKQAFPAIAHSGFPESINPRNRLLVGGYGEGGERKKGSSHCTTFYPYTRMSHSWRCTDNSCKHNVQCVLLQSAWTLYCSVCTGAVTKSRESDRLLHDASSHSTQYTMSLWDKGTASTLLKYAGVVGGGGILNRVEMELDNDTNEKERCMETIATR